MPILVNDQGFQEHSAEDGFTGWEELASMSEAERKTINRLSLSPDAIIENITDLFETVDLIEIQFENFADGRGFSLAKQIRLCGYQGRLRAQGHVLADQHRLARQVGFDEIVIPDELANRQPELQWKLDDTPMDNTYQQRLMKLKAA